MLDFVKAMEIARRLCKEFDDCADCPLRSVGGGLGCAIAADQTGDISEAERRLIEWNKEHPEPQYPTWAQWFEANFCVRKIDLFAQKFETLKPCVFTGEACLPSKTCHGCMAEPIPADIANKLGIKPKEVQTNDCP